MSYRMTEYLCDECRARTESLEDRDAIRLVIDCSCGGRAGRVISAPKIKTVWASAARRGPREEPPHPGCMDTRSLADGEKPREWKYKRKKMRIDARRAQIRANI